MGPRQKLLEAIAPIFAPGERVLIDEAVIDRLVEALGEAIDARLETMMTGSDRAFQATYTGPDGLREAWRDWLETWEQVHFEVEDVELAENAVIAMARQVGITRHGGVVLEQPSAAVFIFSGDRIERVEFHLDRKRALRAVRPA